ncbi:MAG: class I SAM-dependent methyltransferase [Polyangiaceae bacterium]
MARAPSRAFDDRALGPAIDAATRAVELRPDYAIARFFLAGALRWDGAIERARPLLEGAADRAGALAPGLVEVLSFCEQHRSSARATASKFEALTSALSAASASAPVVELGVRHGVSTRLLASRTHATVHAFDSFAGLPTAWHAQRAGAFTTAGELPSVPDNVVFHVGLFEDTLPSFVADLQECPGFVHFDSDLYESARVALAALGPRLGAGTVLCFDEYLGNAHWRADEHRAFTEAAERFGWRWGARTVSWITGQASFVLGA